MIFYKIPCGPLETNTLLIGCSHTKKALVVDPAQGATEFVLQKADVLGLVVEQVLLTHSHWDHIADLAPLVEKTGAVVSVHALDAANVERPGSDGIPLMFEIRGVKPNQFVEDGMELVLGELHYRVIHSPGHSYGSVCYFFPKEKVLISGDTLFAGTIGTLSLPTSEPEKMWKTLAVLSKLPPETQVVPGHGPDTTLANEQWLSRAREIFS